MDGHIQEELDRFIAEAGQYQSRVDEAQKQRVDPKTLLKMQGDFSTFIVSKTTELVGLGISVAAVQDAIRKAMDRVPNTYAPVSSAERTSVSEGSPPDISEEEEIGEMENLEEALKNFSRMDFLVIFSAVDKTVVTGFEDGTINKDTLWKLLANEQLILKNTFESLSMVLGNYRKESEFDAIAFGDILAGSDGEALIPEWFKLFTERMEVYSDPVMYKDSREIKEACGLMRGIDKKTFLKQFNIKKLIKDDIEELTRLTMPSVLPDERKIIKHKDEIAEKLWKDFERLKAFYAEASRNRKWIVVYFLTDTKRPQYKLQRKAK
jgi:hypothetical protein